jgi:mandelate racemase
MTELLEGDPVSPYEIEAKLRKRLILVGATGLTGIGLAAIDMCAWDAAAKAASLPLVQLLGGQVKAVRAYNSCGLWMMPIENLADEAEELLAEGGYQAVKLRVGRDTLADDLSAVRSVKKRIGDDVLLMVDFNQKLTVNEAIARGRALDDEGLYWIEEPIRHDDYLGYARVSAEIQTPIQSGENLHSTYEMVMALNARAVDYVMPDVQRIGGITGWLRAAAIAQAYGIEMSSHLFPEYSAHLLAVTPTCHYLEYMDWSTPVISEPIEIREGRAVIPDRPGAGIEWDRNAVERYTLK